MSNIFNKAIQSYNNQTSTVKNPSPWLMDLMGVSKSGVKISERTSLAISSYYAGINIIANHIATLPVDIVVRDANGNTVDPEHQLNEILKYQANSTLSAFHFKKLLIVNALVYGNGYARIERDGNRITGLHLEKPVDTSVYRNKETGELFYKFKSKNRTYPSRDVIHVYDFSLNGYTGLSVLEAGAKESFEGHLSVQRFSKKYFDNNAHIGGILSTDDSLGSDDKVVNQAKSKIREEFDQVYNGDNNWFRTAILEGDWSYEALDIKASDAMLIERSEATVEDVSRWLQMPLSFLNHTNSQSFKSKEQEAKTYLTNCLKPRMMMFTTEMRNKLFLEAEKQQGYKVTLDTKELTSASLADTAEFIRSAINSSVFDINEVRDFLNMDTKDGLDIHLMQKNMGILGEESEDESAQQALRTVRDKLNDVLGE